MSDKPALVMSKHHGVPFDQETATRWCREQADIFLRNPAYEGMPCTYITSGDAFVLVLRFPDKLEVFDLQIRQAGRVAMPEPHKSPAITRHEVQRILDNLLSQSEATEVCWKGSMTDTGSNFFNGKAVGLTIACEALQELLDG